MSNIINLNKARKARARTAAEKLAAENRIRFGRSKDEKQRERNQSAEAAKKLDGHKLDKPFVPEG
ncbi:MAG: DUF4169 family protein [Pseudomonadota bacterium]